LDKSNLLEEVKGEDKEGEKEDGEKGVEEDKEGEEEWDEDILKLHFFNKLFDELSLSTFLFLECSTRTSSLSL
jgi:uncharacterized sporulation protein YeaH/YhbH (DUF444 family)